MPGQNTNTPPATATAATPVAPPSPPPIAAPLERFTRSGRFSARTDKQAASGQFRYVQLERPFTLELFSPMGTSQAQVVAFKDKATLTLANGKTYQAASLSELLRLVIDLPFNDALFTAWLQGLPMPESEYPVSNLVRGDHNMPAEFSQAGWLIEITARSEDGAIPKRMRWTYQDGNGTEVRWLIDE